MENDPIKVLLDVDRSGEGPDLHREIGAADSRPVRDLTGEQRFDLFRREGAHTNLGVRDDKQLIRPNLIRRQREFLGFSESKGQIWLGTVRKHDGRGGR
jgi:hypothetical protein